MEVIVMSDAWPCELGFFAEALCVVCYLSEAGV